MNSIKQKLIISIISTALLIASATVATAMDSSDVFPSFGTGPAEVRIYASYFCPPCRALEPELDPILKELVESGRIRLTFVDVPMGDSMAYIHYFLYALNSDGSMENALHVRHILFEVATQHGGVDDIREAFDNEGVHYEPFDPTGIFIKFNKLLTEDSIRSTPSAVIYKDGTSRVLTGGKNIISALEDLLKDADQANRTRTGGS